MAADTRPLQGVEEITGLERAVKGLNKVLVALGNAGKNGKRERA